MDNHKKILTILLIVVLNLNLFAQGEGNNWYFGSYAGITFNTNPPSLLNDGRITTSEGCSSVSDRDGNLVFYTDGSNVYGANHVLMPNGTGLYGNPSSTQSSVVCPKPGTYNYGLKRFDRYYIVTIDAATSEGIYAGVRYTEVDMTANGGFGSIVSSSKNIHLFGSSTTEGVNVAKHANGCDYWIIGKEVGSINVRAYLITSSGVSVTPVISSSVVAGVAAVGSIKIAPNNKLICIVNNAAPSIEVFDFDNATGVLTQKFNDNMPWVSGYRGYSAEFSPDNRILYTSTLNNQRIYQYDLSATTNTMFVNSRTVIGTTSNTIGYQMCGLQLAPDGKIYVALQGANRLGAIESPNVLGVGCSYNDNAISISGLNTNGSSMNVVLGLPAFPSFFIFPNDVVYESTNYTLNQKFCSSDSITFQIGDNGGVQSLDWFLSPVNTSFSTTPNSTNLEFKIPPPPSGSYKVLAVVNYACYTDSIYDTIIVNSIPNINLGADIDTCLNGALTLNPTVSAVNNFLWNDGSSNSNLVVASTGQYSVTVTDVLGCTNADTIAVSINEVPNANFLSSANCQNTTAVFNDQSTITTGNISSYEWNFDDGGNAILNSPTHSYLSDGNYSVQLVATSNNNCRDTVVISHTVLPIPISNAGLDTVLNCLNQTIDLDGSASSMGVNYNYLWTTVVGNFTSVVNTVTSTVDNSGMYYLGVTDNNNSCSTLDSVFVSIDTILPVINAGLDTVVNCENPSIIIQGSNTQIGAFNYAWSTPGGNILNGGNNLNATIDKDGLYYFNVINIVNHCSSIDSLQVQIDTIHPVVVVSNDTLVSCLVPEIDLSGAGSSLGNFEYLWSTTDGNVLMGSTSLSPTIDSEGTYELTVLNLENGCSSTGQVYVAQDGEASVNILYNSNQESMISYFTFNDFLLNYQGSNGSVNWFVDGDDVTSNESLEYVFEESGEHTVTIILTNNANGCLAYDTLYVNTTHELQIPNGVSPNGDGHNDLFVIRALENYDENSLLIFNRWGNPVFESQHYENDWEGQTNVSNVLSGENVVDGTYFYVLKLVDNGQEIIYKGFIDLVRK